MANSFGDQFLKAGLVSKDKLNKAKKSKHRQKKAGEKDVDLDAVKTSAKQAAEDKAARDRELNQQQKAAAEQKAIQAQVRQLIELNRLPRDDGESAYNFQDGSAIKTLYVTEEAHTRLGRGQLAIVRYGDGYEVIPAIVAEKIKLRDSACVLSQAEAGPDSDEDDPYADYKVPDDLMW